MRFFSTREKSPGLLISEAIALGLASDGGLYVPDRFPCFQIEDFDGVTEFPEFAFLVLKPFFEADPLSGELEKICKRAFSFPVILKDVRSSQSGLATSVLELFHGPTAAFKDVGARFLAECLSARSRTKQTILVATSGDTGGAVASAFHGRPGFEVVIVFPKDGVSERQRQQLTCWGGNIHTYAVKGSFDTCQKLVKSAFSDPELRGTGKMSSANSINIGRLLPQVTYYAMASIQYLRKHHCSASFIIPTGNAGNAVAALWAKKMGFPIGSIGMATNANRVIPDYFKSGDWKPSASVATLANAMDVGHASNMERAFHLESQGFHLKENVFSVSVSDEEIRKTIGAGEKEYGEIWCPHTATAIYVRNLQRGASQDWIVVSTAHPAKFETIVEPLIGHRIEVPKVLEDLLTLKSNYEEISGDYEDFSKLLFFG